VKDMALALRLLVLLALALAPGVRGRNYDRLFLSKCSCKDDQNRPDCDFAELTKKKLFYLTEKLLTFQIVCVGVGDSVQRYIPTFTSILMPLNKVINPSPSGAINMNDFLLNTEGDSQNALQTTSNGVVSSNQAKSKKRQRSANSCRMDEMTCTGNGVQFIFPTAILAHDLVRDEQTRKYNQDLKEILLDLEEENDGCKYNLHGGYRSKDGFLNRPEPAIQWLKSEIIPRVHHLLGFSNSSQLGFNIDGWGQVLRAGDGQDAHVHPASIFAGVYYVTAPKEIISSGKSGGCLRLIDPRPGAAMAQVIRGKSIYGDNMEICPDEKGGLLVLFPSYLMHEVKPMPASYKGPRVAISFNVMYQP
jgi:uncharacterized protein (TIGR02466 family)